MIRAGKNLKSKLVSSKPKYESLDINDLFNVNANVDSTWQKRYGFNSFLGVVFIISVGMKVTKVGICHMKKTYAVLIIHHHLKYTTYVGNGDSYSFGEVCEAMKKKYGNGNDYLVLKEDCVRHMQERMDSNLRKYKIDAKGKWSNGGTEGGWARLTDAVIDNFQNYYGAAMRNIKYLVHKIKDAVWAIYYHCILCENAPLSQ